MPLLPEAKNCDISVKRNFQLISSKLGYTASPIFPSVTLTDLTASSLVGTNASKLLESVTVSTGLDYTRPTLSLSHLGIEALTDPGADRIIFWDDSATPSACKWLQCGNSIAITTTTIDTIQNIQTTATPLFNALYLNEIADAGSDVGGDGQLWVHDDTPCSLWFTTDAGDDIQLTTGTAVVVTAHTHDGDTLQLDNINSNGGAFGFTTTGAVTFNQDITLSKATTPKFTVESTGDDVDPVICLKTTDTVHEVCWVLDESVDDDHVDFIGQTADKNTRFHIIAKVGFLAYSGVQVGAYRGEFICGSTGHVSLLNITSNKDLKFGIKEGETNRTITWNATEDRLEHSAGLFNFHDDDITTTGVLTATTEVLSKTCTAAAGLNVLRVTGLQTDGTAMTGTLRGAYIDVSNGSTAAIGMIRGMELKARTEAPGDTGNDVAVLEGLSISADSKGHSVTTMRAAEFILDGSTGGTITQAVGLRIANNLQADKATTSYGIEIYRDSFDYTADINLTANPVIMADGTQVIKFDFTDYNVLIGANAGLNDIGWRNVFIGYQAGYNNDTTGTGEEGWRNTYVGFEAGYGRTNGIKNTGYYNVGVGCTALRYNTSGYQNCAIGEGVLQYNTTGSFNSAFGCFTLRDNTTGQNNMAIGTSALYHNTTGESNAAIGTAALYYNQIGGYNVGIGYGAGYGVSDNSYNFDTFIGYNAGYSITTGGRNACIGSKAGYSLSSGSYNIFIGQSAGYRQTTLSNLLIIDNQDRTNVANEITNCLIYGIFNTIPANQSLRINGEILGSDGAKIGDGGTTNYTQFDTDGVQTMAGGARVYKCLQFANAALGKGATKADEVIVGNYWGWSFDINDDAIFIFRLPDDWASGTDAIIKIRWAINEAYVTNSGEVRWQVTWSTHPANSTEAINDAGTTDNSGDINIPATVYYLTEDTVETIPGASLSAGDEIGITLKRVAIGDGSNPTADPIVTCVGVGYTADKLGLAV